jgi:hypothetical protein
MLKERAGLCSGKAVDLLSGDIEFYLRGFPGCPEF